MWGVSRYIAVDDLDIYNTPDRTIFVHTHVAALHAALQISLSLSMRYPKSTEIFVLALLYTATVTSPLSKDRTKVQCAGKRKQKNIQIDITIISHNSIIRCLM
jgi:hypothetical protein